MRDGPADITDGMRAVWQTHDAPSEDDLADLALHGALLTRFVDDLGELLDQLAVAGLAHPDPDLPDVLAGLADRALRLGLGAAMGLIGALEVALVAVRHAAAPGQVAPPELTRNAFAATQRLITWRRLFARDAALQQVEGRLARQALEARGVRAARPTVPTASLRMLPIGFDLDGATATILGVDLHTGGRVTARDHLSEVDPDDPFATPVISRLFQARVALGQVLGRIVEFDAHPVGRFRGGPLFAPAFRAVPRRLEGVEGLLDPDLPVADAAAIAELRRPMRATLTAHRTLDGIVWRDPQGVDADVDPTPALTLNGIKRLIDGGGPLEVVVGKNRGPVRVISARADGRRVFPSHDPGLFALDAGTLYRRALGSDDTDPIVHRFVRTVAGLFGGAADAILDALATAWRGPAFGLTDRYRAAIARHLLHIVAAPEVDAADALAVDDALLLGALDEAPAAALAELRGRPVERGEDLDGRDIYHALWLLFAAGPDQVAARRGALLTLFAARYAGELVDPAPHDIAARTLLLAELAREAAEGEVQAGEEPLTDDEILAPARAFIDAHLADLQAVAGRPTPPLPPFDGLLALADAHRHVYGEAGGLRHMGLDRMALARAVGHALLEMSQRPLEAADALLAAAAAGIDRWFVIRDGF